MKIIQEAKDIKKLCSKCVSLRQEYKQIRNGALGCGDCCLSSFDG
jgi:hypothetical protein